MKKDLEVLETLKEHLYVAPGLVELKITTKEYANIHKVKYHNGIPIANEEALKIINDWYYNSNEKKDIEYVDVVKLSLIQIERMRHCIGFETYHQKNKTYKSHRNYFTSPYDDEIIISLIKIGFMIERPYRDWHLYSVTKKGVEYLEELTGMKIKQNKEDIYE